MRQPEPTPRPPIWVVGVLVLIVIGALITIGWRRGAVPEIEAASTSLASPVTSSLSPAVSSTVLSSSQRLTPGPPGFDASLIGVGSQALSTLFVAHIGQGDTHVVLLTPGNGHVVQDMPSNTHGPIRFDLSRTQYAFTDSVSRLHLRQTRVTTDQADFGEPIALDVRSFAWSLDEAERIAWVSLDERGPLLVEGTNPVRVIGNPGYVDLVGYDSTGFYVVGGGLLGTPGEMWLRKLDLDGAFVAEIPADVVHVGSTGGVVIGRVQPATVDGPHVFDWFITDQLLASLTPMVGAPPSATAIATNRSHPLAVAFLTYDTLRAHIDVYRTETGLTRRFDLGEVRAWGIQWSDLGDLLVVSGTEQRGRGHLVQLLDTQTGFTAALRFDDWVQSAQLIWQP